MNDGQETATFEITEKIGTRNWGRIDLILVFLIVLLPRLYDCVQMVPVRTISDEIASMSTGAFFAGLDWSAVISNAGYYGGGFSILLTPVFALTDNPFVIYTSALVLASLVQSLTAPISYHLMTRYFHVKSRWYALIGAVACSFMVVTRSNIFYNESMLILIVWLSTWMLCILYNCTDKRKKILYSVLLVLLLSYSLTVHIRSYVLWIALVIVILCYFIAYRKWLMSKAVLVIGGVAGILLSNVFINFIQANIWLVGEGETVRNSSVRLATSANLMDPVTWQTWLDIILGQIYSIGIYSGTILVIALAVFVPLIASVLFIKKRRMALENHLYFVVSLMFILCIGMTIAAQSVSWLSSAIRAMQGEDSYGFKAFTYIRYFGPYCGPVFMATLAYLWEHGQKLRKILYGSLGVLAVLQAYWVLDIVPSIDGYSVSGEIFTGFVNSVLDQYTDAYMYLVPICILFAFLICAFVLYKNKKANVVITFLAVFLIWEYAQGSFTYDISRANRRPDKVMTSYDLVKEMEEDNDIALPDTIYVIDTSDAVDHNTFYLYQFYLNRYKIQPNYPDEDCEEAIVFCNEHGNKELLEMGYAEYQLDDNEWVYVLGENYINEIESTLKQF